MKNFFYILGLLSAVTGFELFFKGQTYFTSPLTDNNSFIPKKKAFDRYLETHNHSLNGMSIFIGSSFFARGIDCTNMTVVPCLNLSLDGGDARSYQETYLRFLRTLKPKRIIFELTQIVFADYDYSGPAIKGYLTTPWENLRPYIKRGLTSDFKQSLKNQVDAMLLSSGLNFFSRRNRFTEWPRLLEAKITGPKLAAPIKPDQEISAYFDPNQEKLKMFQSLLDELNRRGILVSVVATPENYQGEVDSPWLERSPVFMLFKTWEKEKKLSLIHSLTKQGLPKDSFADELNHLGRDKMGLLSGILQKEIKTREKAGTK